MRNYHSFVSKVFPQSRNYIFQWTIFKLIYKNDYVLGLKYIDFEYCLSSFITESRAPQISTNDILSGQKFHKGLFSYRIINIQKIFGKHLMATKLTVQGLIPLPDLGGNLCNH